MADGAILATLQLEAKGWPGSATVRARLSYCRQHCRAVTPQSDGRRCNSGDVAVGSQRVARLCHCTRTTVLLQATLPRCDSSIRWQTVQFWASCSWKPKGGQALPLYAHDCPTAGNTAALWFLNQM